MELQDQFISREEAIAQRDYHQTHADQWLGHLVIGASTGNGGGLVALGAFVAAREITGWSLIVAGAAAVSFLVGLGAATYCAGLIRHQALMLRAGYNGIVQEKDYATHFPQAGEAHEVMKKGLVDNTQHAFNSAGHNYNPINRAANFFVFAFLIGTVLTATSVATNAFHFDNAPPTVFEDKIEPAVPAIAPVAVPPSLS